MNSTNLTNFDSELDLESVEQRLNALAALHTAKKQSDEKRNRILKEKAWRWFSLFVSLSVIVSIWLSYELGFLGSRRVEASEPPQSGIESLQRSLEERTKALGEREESISKREKNLVEKEKILTEQLNRYEKALSDVKIKLTEFEKMKDSRVEAFRQVYEKMDPKKASKILDEMDVVLSSQILSGMKGERAADILSRMSTERARLVTEKSLGKRTISATKVNEENVSTDGSATKGTPARGG